MRLPDLVARARQLPGGGRAVLGITGSPGAGKTTVALGLLRALRAEPPAGLGPDAVAHVPMDGFHLADVALRRLGLLDRKGAPETFDAAGYVALLRRLREVDPTRPQGLDEPVYAPMFERDLEQPLAGAIAVPRPVRLVLTEGNYLLHDAGRWREVRAELDEVWFCDLRPDVRLARLTARHVAFGKTPGHATSWVAAVDERNAALVEATRDRADLLIPSAVLEEPADELASGPPRSSTHRTG